MPSSERCETPFVVVDLEVVRERYLSLACAIPVTTIYYTVKANPMPEVLNSSPTSAPRSTSHPGEVDASLAAGADPAHISFGNTVKKVAASRTPTRRASASSPSTATRARQDHRPAPGSTVSCRILCDGKGADWPLSRKFGCAPEPSAD